MSGMSLEDRIKAEQQVEAFVQILATRYNLKEEEIPQIIDNIKWIGNHRNGIYRLSWAAGLAVVALGVSGLATATLEGIKQFFR